jgi:serine/threonine-protein kinase
MVGEAPAAEPGARVGGKYVLVRRLATGGMGDVWIARNDATGAEVAAKWCKAEAAAGQAVERLRQEARVGATLAHRNIVRVFDLVEDPDRGLLLVMELLRGETLESYLRGHGALSADEAIEIALPLLSALAHAHAAGIIHRDVTPANVVLDVDPDGHVTPKLLDFGIAKVSDSEVQTADGRVLGSPRYMAPERIRGKGIDPRSDLFSVGVLLYEMITGASPFAATTPSASLAAVLETVVDPDPRIPPRVWIEIRRALAKQPYERHRDARAMAEALQAARGRPPEPEASPDDVARMVLPIVGSRVDGESGVASARVDGESGVASARGGRRRAVVVAGASAVLCILAAAMAIGRWRTDRSTASAHDAPAVASAPSAVYGASPAVGAPIEDAAVAGANAAGGPAATSNGGPTDAPGRVGAPSRPSLRAAPPRTTQRAAASSVPMAPSATPRRSPRSIATSPGF